MSLFWLENYLGGVKATQDLRRRAEGVGGAGWDRLRWVWKTNGSGYRRKVRKLETPRTLTPVVEGLLEEGGTLVVLPSPVESIKFLGRDSPLGRCVHKSTPPGHRTPLPGDVPSTTGHPEDLGRSPDVGTTTVCLPGGA